MFNNIVALGYGIIVLAIMLGVGSVVLYNFGGASAVCPTGNGTWTWNTTTNDCWNGSTSKDPGGSAITNTDYMLTQLGSSGLAGWTPAIIAISVGMLFLGYFAIGKGKNRY